MLKEIEINPEFSQIEARPGQSLEEHLYYVNNIALQHFKSLKLNLSLILEDLVKISLNMITFTHDFGKATIYFQESLYSSIKKSYDRNLKNHSLYSSLFSLSIFFVLKRYIKKELKTSIIHNINFQDLFNFLGFATQLIVRCHHGNLKDLFAITDDFNEDIIRNHQKRLKNCSKDFIKYILSKYLIPALLEFKQIFNFEQIEAGKLSHQIYKESIELIKKILTDPRFRLVRIYGDLINSEGILRGASFEFSQNLFFLIKLMNSILLEADKINSAMGINIPVAKNLLSTDFHKRLKNFLIEKRYLIENEFFPKKFESLNQRRRYILNKLMNYQPPSSEQGIISLFTVPTGFGKTYSSLIYASSLSSPRSMLLTTDSFFITPRIIYSLPFLSIIDQTESIIEEFIHDENSTNSSLFLVHHHLTEPVFNLKDNADEQIDESVADLLMQSWNSQYILTTFNQLLNSIFKSSKTSCIKFSKLINSTWILDELQAIPLRYWKLLNSIFLLMKDVFYTNILLMSATLPRILSDKSSNTNLDRTEIHNLIDETIYHQITKDFNRIELIYKGEIGFEEFISTIKKVILENSDKNILVVLNTRRSAQTVYKEISKIKENNKEINSSKGISKFNLKFLAATQTPFLKSKVINQIKALLNDKTSSCVLISTQCIEAGVDVDFDIVIRDFAPLDNIIQVAGRCNRNNIDKNNHGIIEIYRIKTDTNKNQYFSNYIYDQHLLTLTEQLLRSYGSFPIRFKEEQIHEVVLNYYNMVENFFKNTRMKREVMNFRSYIQKFQFGTLSESFTLIEKLNPYTFYIEENEEATKILNQYIELKKTMKKKNLNNQFPKQKYNKLLRIKKSIQKYIITAFLNKKEQQNLKFFKNLGYFYLIRNKDLKNYYSHKLGFLL